MAVSDAYVFPGFLTPVLTQLFLSKATEYFSRMLQQRWEAKIRRKEISPQPGLELTITRSWVQHAPHWATRAGLDKTKRKELKNSVKIPSQEKGITVSSYHQYFDGYLPLLYEFPLRCYHLLSLDQKTNF